MNIINIRLSAMMFMQFFIWGGWFVTLGTFMANNLSATGADISMAYSTQSWGAIIAPFFVGLIADRFFNAEKVLAVLHLMGALLMFAMYQSSDVAEFYPYVLGYMIVFMPTLALVNSVSFAQLTDPSAQFGKIRVWGTIGWIVAGLFISYVFSWDSQANIESGFLANTFLLCSGVSLVLGLYCFTLPSTPPLARGKKVALRDILGLDALSLLKQRNFFIFFVSSVLICIPLAFYYQNANPFLTEIGVENATGKMTIGQMSEVLFMLTLPIFLNRFGIKITLLIGMFAWALRYVLFAFGSADEGMVLLLVGIALHGICYDFFFVSGQIYTDQKAGKDIKSAAQGMITFATYGVGMLIGFWLAGKITDSYALAQGHSWTEIWLFPAAFAAAVMVVFAFLFTSEKTVAETTKTEGDPHAK